MPTHKDFVSHLGDIMQLAFVPKDFDAAIKYWTEQMGVGPFFRSVPKADKIWYRGQPADIQFEMVIGYWGDIQIELIRQTNDTPSIYTTWLDEGREGLHHTCIIVDDIEKARDYCNKVGAEVMQELHLGTTRAIYVDAGGGPGTLLEILQTGDAGKAAFAMMRDTAKTWDGTDPVRGRQASGAA